MAHAPWIVAIENRERPHTPWTEVAPEVASPIASALTTPDASLEPIQLPAAAAAPLAEFSEPAIDPRAQEMWEAYMEDPGPSSGPQEIDEMWLAYKEAMAEPSPPARRPKLAPIPQTPGRAFNPTWTEKTDTYDSITRKTLYFGFTALGASRPDFAE